MLLSRASHYFLEVVRCGSIRRAAEMLHISGSSIDRQILQLEAHAGVALFLRTAEGLKPTGAGLLLAEALDDCRAILDDALQRVDRPAPGIAGKITIAVSEGAGDFVAETLLPFCRQHGQVEVLLHIANALAVRESVLAGTAEIGVTFNPGNLASIQVEAEFASPVGVVVPNDHALASRETISLRECAGYALLLPDHSFALRRKLERAWESSMGTRLGGVISADSGTMLKRLVLNGTGIALVSSMEVRSEVAEGRLRFLPLREKKLLQSTLAIIRQTDRVLSPGAAHLLSKLVDQFDP
jgi:DNA-binding transcriptional LysR family regulator